MRSPAVLPPPPRPTPIERLLSPFQRYIATEAAGGVVLLVCTLVALSWANSPWRASYEALLGTELALRLGTATLTHPLHTWINEGLMTVFFFLVGLEIKREVLVGELASARGAALPVAGALGGMLVPALLFISLNGGTEAARGWGIPMATDIAFAVGVLALLGPRVPLALRVFLTALAIVDDIGAVAVIALFYTSTIQWGALALAGTFLLALALANALGARRPLVYLLLGVAVWLAFLRSGVHATLAGVLVAMTVPARTRIDTAEFLRRGRALIEEFDAADEAEGPDRLPNPAQRAVIQALEQTCEQAEAPLQRIEHALQPWVAFGIVPLFALANAGVSLEGAGGTLTSRVTLGVLLGLLIGKPLGITLFAWLAVRLKLAALPAGATWRALHAVSWLGGIGFTMSLFITALAFGAGVLVTEAKVGILLASLGAGLVGGLLLRRLPATAGGSGEMGPRAPAAPALEARAP